ncbi:MAG: hypothetical protein J6S76_00305 [Clostridia bacterium]|nr:hypothetical protein [Clostridia bacterium]
MQTELGGTVVMYTAARGICTVLWGGFLYGLVEILFRGYTHVSMFVLGGVCFVCIGAVRRLYADASAAKRMLLCAGIVTLLELVCGLLVNVKLGLAVWDYSMMPYNVLGQICVTYTAAWCLLAVPAMALDRLFCRAWRRESGTAEKLRAEGGAVPTAAE